MNFLARLRKLVVAASILGTAAVVGACSSGADEPARSSGDAITNVEPTSAKRQSIGNCWLYATATWAEALHQQASGEAIDVSEAYWTYWYWFDQLTDGVLRPLGSGLFWSRAIDTGGSYEAAAELIARYGWMKESDFIPGDEANIRSQRQATALLAINESMSSGALSTREAREDRAVVLAELDRAWQLTEALASRLKAVFGQDGGKTLLDQATQPDGPIYHGNEMVVPGTSPSGGLTLRDLVGDSGPLGPLERIAGKRRIGAHAWSSRQYGSGADATTLEHNRTVVKQIQVALHGRNPVLLNWEADDRHIDGAGAFKKDPQRESDERPYGHAAVIVDYEVDQVPGFGLLRAGVDETRPEALRAALDDRAVVKFFRVKNPWWGTYSASAPPIPFSPAGEGYHDLDLEYLDAVGSAGRRLRSVYLPPDTLIKGD